MNPHEFPHPSSRKEEERKTNNDTKKWTLCSAATPKGCTCTALGPINGFFLNKSIYLSWSPVFCLVTAHSLHSSYSSCSFFCEAPQSGCIWGCTQVIVFINSIMVTSHQISFIKRILFAPTFFYWYHLAGAIIVILYCCQKIVCVILIIHTWYLK